MGDGAALKSLKEHFDKCRTYAEYIRGSAALERVVECAVEIAKTFVPTIVELEKNFFETLNAMLHSCVYESDLPPLPKLARSLDAVGATPAEERDVIHPYWEVLEAKVNRLVIAVYYGSKDETNHMACVSLLDGKVWVKCRYKSLNGQDQTETCNASLSRVDAAALRAAFTKFDDALYLRRQVGGARLARIFRHPIDQPLIPEATRPRHLHPSCNYKVIMIDDLPHLGDGVMKTRAVLADNPNGLLNYLESQLLSKATASEPTARYATYIANGRAQGEVDENSPFTRSASEVTGTAENVKNIDSRRGILIADELNCLLGRFSSSETFNGIRKKSWKRLLRTARRDDGRLPTLEPESLARYREEVHVVVPIAWSPFFSAACLPKPATKSAKGRPVIRTSNLHADKQHMFRNFAVMAALNPQFTEKRVLLGFADCPAERRRDLNDAEKWNTKDPLYATTPEDFMASKTIESMRRRARLGIYLTQVDEPTYAAREAKCDIDNVASNSSGSACNPFTRVKKSTEMILATLGVPSCTRSIRSTPSFSPADHRLREYVPQYAALDYSTAEGARRFLECVSKSKLAAALTIPEDFLRRIGAPLDTPSIAEIAGRGLQGDPRYTPTGIDRREEHHIACVVSMMRAVEACIAGPIARTAHAEACKVEHVRVGGAWVSFSAMADANKHIVLADGRALGKDHSPLATELLDALEEGLGPRALASSAPTRTRDPSSA
eukprot:tig00000411_g518.t1